MPWASPENRIPRFWSGHGTFRIEAIKGIIQVQSATHIK